jgi:8-oxo-dGTP diphosphatase
MAQTPIEGAGGVLVRAGTVPLVAVVQRRKDNGWVLPKGKLKPRETAIAAAEREVVEETGHQVSVHEFLGVVSYKAANGKPKVVQFWRMQARDGRPRKLMRDIKAVKWLPLEAAIDRLDHPLEQLFLRNVGHRAIAAVSTPDSAGPVGEALASDSAGLVVSESNLMGAQPSLVGRIRQWWRLMTSGDAETPHQPAGNRH